MRVCVCVCLFVCVCVCVGGAFERRRKTKWCRNTGRAAELGDGTNYEGDEATRLKASDRTLLAVAGRR